jgi:signal peptidase II
MCPPNAGSGQQSAGQLVQNCQPHGNPAHHCGNAEQQLGAESGVNSNRNGPILREVQSIELIPFFRLTWTENMGVSLGLLTAGSETQRWLLVALTGAIALIVLVWMLREKLIGDTLPLGLVSGGAAGNILDRARFGYVVDFADLHFGNFRPFLIFNLADAAITIGVLIILLRSFLSREKSLSTPQELPES